MREGLAKQIQAVAKKGAAIVWSPAAAGKAEPAAAVVLFRFHEHKCRGGRPAGNGRRFARHAAITTQFDLFLQAGVTAATAGFA